MHVDAPLSFYGDVTSRSPLRRAVASPGPDTLQQLAEQATAGARKWIERLARWGYAAKGVVYILVGGLAALAAVEAGGGGAPGSRGALRSLLGQPLGTVILFAIGVGLLGYVLWRFVQAFADPDRHGTDAKGLGLRGFFVVNGLIYLSLALAAVAMALGRGGGGGDGGMQSKVADLMGQPMGPWLVGAVGLTVVGVGVYQFVRAYTAKFRKRLKTGEMSAAERRWSTRIGRFGFAARGVTFLIIGGFIVRAALEHDPSEARGLDAAFRWLESQPYGTWLLGVVAVGLVAYGCFQIVMARYRRIGVA